MEHVTHSLQRSEMMVAVLNSLSNGTMIAVIAHLASITDGHHNDGRGHDDDSNTPRLADSQVYKCSIRHFPYAEV